MCLGIPLKIMEINGTEAVGEMYGIKRKIRIDFLNDLKLGDYVMVHAGFALEIIDPEFARETMDALAEVEKAALGK